MTASTSSNLPKGLKKQSPETSQVIDGFHMEIDIASQTVTLDNVKVDASGKFLDAGAQAEDLKAQLKAALQSNPHEDLNAAAPSAASAPKPALKAQAEPLIMAQAKASDAHEAENKAAVSEASVQKEQALKAQEVKDQLQPLDKEASAPKPEEPAVFADDVKKGSLTDNGDDPDRVPVVPTLRDDEVPNMPGAILCHAREMLGLSQRDIAMRLKLRVNTISDIEHDRLNQPTAAPFVRGHLQRYAELVNIDPRAILDLYNQNVDELSSRMTFGAPQKRIRKSSLKTVVYSIIGLAIAGGLVISFFMDNDKVSQDSGPLVIETELAGQDGASGVLQEEGEILTAEHDAPQEESAPKEVLLDPNNAKAYAQAQALSESEELSELPAAPASDEPLTVEGVIEAPVPENPAPAQIAEHKEVALPAAVQSAQGTEQKALGPAAQGAAAGAQNSKSEALQSAALEQKPAASQPAASSKTAVNAKPAESAPLQVKEELKKEEPKEEAPAAVLSRQTLDISDRARLQDRDGLASLNTVEITVKAPVALSISGNGKTLVSGTYKAGDKVRATGIPPITVAASDTAAISVSYAGGRVAVPSVKQAHFTLPMR